MRIRDAIPVFTENAIRRTRGSFAPPSPARRLQTGEINMRHPPLPFIYSERGGPATLSRVTLSRAFLQAASSSSPPRRRDTCQCQSNRNNTQMICSFGLIKSFCLSALLPLRHVIAARRPSKAASCLGDERSRLLYEGFVSLPLSLPSHSYS